jgi:microcystin-dependent protein
MSVTFRMKGLRNRIISETSNIDFNYGNLDRVNTINVTGSIQQNGADLVPNGVIVMWSGLTTPNGWALCDGTNGTPDLRGRFILSAGNGTGLTSRTIGQTGGEENHTLTTSEMPSHSHTGTTDSNGSHSHSINDPGHTHTWNHGTESDDSGSGGSYSEYTNIPGSVSGVIANATTGISINTNGDHTHTITTNNTGSGDAHNNMPPYYVLAYIMKL